MRAKDEDPQQLQVIFSTEAFDIYGWLNSLSPEALADYANTLEKNRTTTSQIQSIVDRVPAYAAIKVKLINITKLNNQSPQ